MITDHPSLIHPKYRADIDGLRAVAVLSVLIFHAFPEWLPGGFIGVDVFFVISGYLISTIIFENCNEKCFSFLEFYSRRINRIFPSLLVVLAFSYAFGWLNLLADDFAQLGKHIAGGAGFISNLVLWNESGYFDKAAELKPLLHLWSLGIEEQFYFVWPLAIYFIVRWPKKLLPFIVAIALLSFGLNVAYINANPVATFYSPITRFWELLIGSLLAYLTVYRSPVLHAIQEKYQSVLSALGLTLILLGSFILNQKSAFPGWWALMPTVGAALVIGAGTNAGCNKGLLSNKGLVWFGLISFPLYLWHWPLLAFARLQEGETPSLMIRAALVLLSIILAWVTYRFVEKPIRFNASYRTHKNIALVFLMIVIAYLGYNCFDRKGIAFRHKFFMKEISGYTFDKVAEQRQRTCFLMDIGDDVNNFSKTCIHNDRPYKLVLWGDSHGGSLYPGFAELEKSNAKIAVTQFTAAGCGGLLPTEEQGPFCRRANELAMKEILNLKPNLVVIYKAWSPFYYPLIKPTIELLHEHGIQVLIVGPTPRWKDDLPKVVYRYWKKHKELPPAYYGESLDPNIYQMDEQLRKIAQENHALYYSAWDRLCNLDGCLTRIPKTDNALTTLDEDHITPAAARYLVQGLNQDTLSNFVK
ncbi:acyltransferase family protein [Polynucleobacter sp. MWH-UH23A]|uniref:acyltransferase family protein n=1 Tax=Polynucleobacter sp. MWH-UH23A TaxID=1855613 RepID=UPI0033650CC7